MVLFLLSSIGVTSILVQKLHLPCRVCAGYWAGIVSWILCGPDSIPRPIYLLLIAAGFAASGLADMIGVVMDYFISRSFGNGQHEGTRDSSGRENP
jgi:hypothetical protein